MNRQPSLTQHLLPQLLIRTPQPHNHRLIDTDLLERHDDALRNHIAQRQAAKDVDKHDGHARVAEDQLERRLDRLGRRFAARVEEVGGCGVVGRRGEARVQHVVCVHGEAGAVDERADEVCRLCGGGGRCASQRDVHDACGFGCGVCGRDAGFVAEGVEVGLPLVGLEGCVVEEEVRVCDVDCIVCVRDGEGDVCVDGFFLAVEVPEVFDEVDGLGFGFGRCGVELQVGDSVVYDGG